MDQATIERVVTAIVAEVSRQAQLAPASNPQARLRLCLVLADGELSEQRWRELEQLRDEPVQVTALLCESLARPEAARQRLQGARLVSCGEAEDPVSLVEGHDAFYLPQINRLRLAGLASLTSTCPGSDVLLEALAAGKPVHAVEDGWQEVARRWRAGGTRPGQAMAERLERLARECSAWGLTWVPGSTGLAALRRRWTEPPSPTARPTPPSTAGRPLITAADVEAVQGDELTVPPGAIITPLARDVARQRNVRLTER